MLVKNNECTWKYQRGLIKRDKNFSQKGPIIRDGGSIRKNIVKRK